MAKKNKKGGEQSAADTTPEQEEAKVLQNETVETVDQ
jgi:hypothetical protein